MTITAIKPIRLDACKSSLIAEYGYDSASQTLAVRFVNGALVYRYQNVPPEVVAEMTEAKSIGRFFADKVRGNFDYTYAELDDRG